jgi:hypothetical protein
LIGGCLFVESIMPIFNQWQQNCTVCRKEL